jgi:hypothetical protein
VGCNFGGVPVEFHVHNCLNFWRRFASRFALMLEPSLRDLSVYVNALINWENLERIKRLHELVAKQSSAVQEFFRDVQNEAREFAESKDRKRSAEVFACLMQKVVIFVGMAEGEDEFNRRLAVFGAGRRSIRHREEGSQEVNVSIVSSAAITTFLGWPPATVYGHIARSYPKVARAPGTGSWAPEGQRENLAILLRMPPGNWRFYVHSGDLDNVLKSWGCPGCPKKEEKEK